MSKDEEKVEVFELTQEQWDDLVQKQLDKLGLTALELKQKHDNNTMTAQEFKIWMILAPSTLLD